MSVVMMIDNPHGSQEIYERVAAGRTLPIGGSVHLAGPGPNGGWRVIEVWETPEDAQRFAKERLMPAFEAVGAPPPPAPEFWPVTDLLKP